MPRPEVQNTVEVGRLSQYLLTKAAFELIDFQEINVAKCPAGTVLP